jgi:hypothetical protein
MADSIKIDPRPAKPRPDLSNPEEIERLRAEAERIIRNQERERRRLRWRAALKALS